MEHEYSCLIYLCTCENIELDDLKAENARLKEALENIATLGNIFEEKASAQVAIEALKGAE